MKCYKYYISSENYIYKNAILNNILFINNLIKNNYLI